MTRSISYGASIALAAAVLAIAGCGGDDEGGDVVSRADVEGTEVLADAQGRTLYTAAVEEGGKILCVGACTSFWEPVVASPGDAERAAGDLEADLSVLERPDGEQQLTLDGLPLYTFTEEDAGQITGDGFVDDFRGTHFEWSAARTGGGSASRGGTNGY
jgi:predicted lipoprotein with Yx(FWY)xxD motif